MAGVEQRASWNIGAYQPYAKAKHGLCSHCGTEPRHGKGRYCRACKASYMRAWRASKKPGITNGQA